MERRDLTPKLNTSMVELVSAAVLYQESNHD
jgi:hypothetical protein